MENVVIRYDIYWLNEPPTYNGLSDTLSTFAIVQGLININYDNLNIDFGSYAQVHPGTNNNTKSITAGSIDLQSSG